MTFYLKDSDQEYFSKFWVQERKYLSEVGGRLLTVDEANTHPFNDLLITGSKGIVGIDAMKPRLTHSYHYFCIPYELGEEIEEGLVPETIISQLINDNLKSAIFIASTDASFGCFGECFHTNEETIWNFSSSHLNTPFLIFDNEKKVFALIDYDLPLQIIGYKTHVLDSKDYIKSEVGRNGWDTVFERYSHYTNMPHLFNEYYKFLLPDKVVKFLDSIVIPPPVNCTQK